jgi:5-methylcytosine-specific restriction endonuclease McrA
MSMRLSFSSLNDNELHARLPELCRREREITFEILLHLNEVERRKLHLKQGYSSMFVYCTAWLGYSEPAAFRRIRTARCVARFPEIYALLEANEVNLSTIARASRVLTANNKNALLERIRRRSRREVDAIVAEYEPQARRRDVVRAVAVRVPAALGPLELSRRGAADSGSAAGLTTGNEVPVVGQAPPSNVRISSVGQRSCESSDYLRREGDSHPTVSTEKRVQLQFTVSESFQRKLEKIRSLAWHRLPANASLEQLFNLVMDEFIEKHDPRVRQHRRERRAKAITNPQKVPLMGQRAEDQSRYVAAAVKDDVFVRDNAQCTFEGPDGRRCGETRNLHVDHIVPRTRNGTNDVNNLRILCAQHNQLEAERILGRRLMSRYRSPV